MGEYTLSVVQLCPDAYRDAANTIAEAAGYGPGNLSVELRHADGSIWWGCHASWIPRVFEAMTAPTGDPAVDGVMAAVVPSTVDMSEMTEAEREVVPLSHWHEALAANGLSVYATPDA